MVDPVALMMPAFGLVMVGAAYGLYDKGRFYRMQSERIANTDVSDIGSIEPGTVAVEGTARVEAGEGTVTTELTGEEALASHSKVIAKEDHVDTAGPDDENVERQVLHETSHAVPFRVEDDTGSVLVDTPDEADYRLDENTVIERGRNVPDVADLADDPDAATAERISIGDTHQWLDYERRYEQGSVRPGESVYVLGEAVDRADWDGDDVAIAGGEEPELFILSDVGRAQARRGGTIGAYVAYGMACLVGFVGALLLVFGSLAVVW
ncbi:hypothetical protein C479_02641 [Halovivax asiaticus JCM 14624]|uniref:RING-type E3 ubiquitin transferase n=1 Tax=Halovivax asiaticus JCM 14624 TaxID=1227490 RepID=M0BUA9_9EURY|nr:hypothetical protein [Halovivax asiaticus]ELZ13707.1 hypothetical protein C479_02641 [Halovivax asiaticus JCM 14624]